MKQTEDPLELKEKGIITEEDSNQKKAELLENDKNKEQESVIIATIKNFFDANAKKKQIIYLLSSLLGVFGLHNFYIGEKDRGFIKLPVGLFFIWQILNFDNYWGRNFHQHTIINIVFILSVIFVQIKVLQEIYTTTKTYTGKNMEPFPDKFKVIFYATYCILMGFEFGIYMTIYYIRNMFRW